MAVGTFNFTTGPATMLDVGTLAYNGVTFSPLFESTISGKVVQDSAGRTTKMMEYDIAVDGYVTINTGDIDIDARMNQLRTLLTQPGGSLQYQGRGFDIILNSDINNRDVAWGPVPELLDFQTMGAGRSAKVLWRVKVRISEQITNKSGKPPLPGSKGNNADIPMLQFCYNTSVSYGEDFYSTLSVSGVLEIPLTRTPGQKTRTLAQTADDLRGQIDQRIMTGIDLSRFRVTRREYPLSRDRRTMEFNVTIEEKPYMDLPPDCPVARGTFTVRPAKAGMGLCNWLCTLRATYVVRPDRPRRTAWLAFLAILRERMAEGALAPDIDPNANQNPPRANIIPANLLVNPATARAVEIFTAILMAQKKKVEEKPKNVLLIDFNIEEGMYLDSKTVSFSATWRLLSPFTHILLASGLWKKVPENNQKGENLYALSMRDVSGSQSWLPNSFDPALDIIVDFGS